MTQKRPLSRPASSAIAAFLVLSTPAAFAQEAPTVPMSPPVAVPPATQPTVAQPSPAPTAAPEAAQPTATPVIRVPLDVAPEPAEPAPQARERAAAAPPARAPRNAPRARTAAVAAPAAVAAAPVAEAPTAEIVPIAAQEVAAPAEPVAVSPLPAEAADTTGTAFPWEIAGGAAALLLVGGAGVLFARRRRASREVWEFDEAPADAEWVPGASAEPATATPALAAAADEPAVRDTPSFAAAPHGSMGRHEALALAGPTPDNPFGTLKKRLQRARFLDRQERAAYEETLAGQKDMTRKPVSAWEIAQRPAATPVAEQEVRRPERGTGRAGDLRPGWLRN